MSLNLRSIAIVLIVFVALYVGIFIALSSELSNYQDFVGAIFTGVSTLALGYVALFRDEIRDRDLSRRREREFARKFRNFRELVSDYSGSLSVASSQLENAIAGENCEALVYLKRPPKYEVKLKGFEYFLPEYLDPYFTDFDIANEELCEAFRPNGMDMYLKYELSSKAPPGGLKHVKILLDRALEATDRLTDETNRLAETFNAKKTNTNKRRTT